MDDLTEFDFSDVTDVEIDGIIEAEFPDFPTARVSRAWHETESRWCDADELAALTRCRGFGDKLRGRLLRGWL